MGVARRIYLYVVSLLALAAVGVGFQNLLTVMVGQVVDSLGSSVIQDGGGVTRGQTSLAIALLVVGTPVWLIHWWLAQRGTRGTDEHAAEERGSALRAFHLSLVRAIAIITLVGLGSGLVALAIRTLLGEQVELFGVAEAIASVLVAGPAWVYHSAVADGDARAGAHRDAAGALTRLYRYGTAFGALVMAMAAVSVLIDTVFRMLLGRPDFVEDSNWWRVPLAGSITALAIGLPVWWVHWRASRSLVRNGVVIGDDERGTMLRSAYIGGVVLLAASLVAFAFAGSIAEVGRLLLGIPSGDGLAWILEAIVGPPVAVLPFYLAAQLHVAARGREAARVGADLADSSRRVVRHLVALVGLAFLTAGAYQLIGLALDAFFAGSSLTPEGDFVRRQLPWYVSQTVVGLALWIPAWAAILRRRAVAPALERRAGAARAYLYLVVGLALVAAVTSGIFILYRLIDALLGGESAASLGADLTTPLAVLVVGGVIAAYHGRLVLGDFRATADQAPAAPRPAPIAPPAATPPPAGLDPLVGASALELVLRGPAGTDLGAIADGLRERLPTGVTLDGA